MKVDTKVVQEILGHSHISITLGIYARVLLSTHEEAMKKMDVGSGLMIMSKAILENKASSLV